MTLTIIIAIIIHLLVLFIGVFLFLRLKRKIAEAEIINPPVIDIFFLFVTYGGLIFVTLTTLFWKWSGMASLGTFYLILAAPIIMSIISYRQYKKQKLSKYHKNTFLLGIIYFIIAPLTFLALYLIDNLK